MLTWVFFSFFSAYRTPTANSRLHHFPHQHCRNASVEFFTYRFVLGGICGSLVAFRLSCCNDTKESANWNSRSPTYHFQATCRRLETPSSKGETKAEEVKFSALSCLDVDATGRIFKTKRSVFLRSFNSFMLLNRSFVSLELSYRFSLIVFCWVAFAKLCAVNSWFVINGISGCFVEVWRVLTALRWHLFSSIIMWLRLGETVLFFLFMRKAVVKKKNFFGRSSQSSHIFVFFFSFQITCFMRQELV